jgi:hypothetical protein
VTFLVSDLLLLWPLLLLVASNLVSSPVILFFVYGDEVHS